MSPAGARDFGGLRVVIPGLYRSQTEHQGGPQGLAGLQRSQVLRIEVVAVVVLSRLLAGGPRHHPARQCRPAPERQGEIGLGGIRAVDLAFVATGDPERPESIGGVGQSMQGGAVAMATGETLITIRIVTVPRRWP
jgi:hypothetical protein